MVRGGPHRSQVDADEAARIAKMTRDGCTPTTIRERTGRSLSIIYRVLVEAGLRKGIKRRKKTGDEA